MDSAFLSPISAASTAPSEPAPKSVKEAAIQFEALLLQQMFKSARESSDSGSEDATGASMKEYAEQNLSQLLAKNGGIGLSSLLARGLEPPAAPTSKSGGASGHVSATMRRNGNQAE